MSLDLPELGCTSLYADGGFDGGVINVRFSGTADAEATTDLDHVVERLHDEALRLGATKVAVDFRQLEFMNSSCFKILVTWLSNVRELEPRRQYRIHILSSPEHHWQKRSLEALRCFAVDLVAIDI